MPGTAPLACRTDVWRGGDVLRHLPTIPTGHAALDRNLPGGGWPIGSLTEIMTATPGHGEFSLLFSMLADLTAQGRWAILLDPPWAPYPPAMRGHGVVLERVLLVRTANARESLWACEQALRAVRGGAVIAWHDNPGFARLRRLQLAAHSGHKPAFLFRDIEAARQASPAALRLAVEGRGHHIHVSLLKCRGPRPTRPVLLRRSPHLPGMHRLPKWAQEVAPPFPERPVSPVTAVEEHVH